jgi:TolB-like protein
MTPALRLRILGTPGIEGPAGALSGPATTGQTLALLAVLACAGGRGVARDKLFALFWPEAPTDRASHRLSQLAHHARRGLDCSDLIEGSTELRLNPERIATDLWEFVAARQGEEMERAAELYAGPLLDGFFISDSAALERWVESRRSALAREYQETLEALAVQAELRGDPHAAAGWWRRLADHEPLSSRVTMHLMTALAAAGDRARALEQAQAYQSQVREELEAEPNPGVMALAKQLRAAERHRSIAIGILPLTPLDAGADSHSLAQGLTEELTTAAGALPGVRVASRTSLAALQRTVQDVREIGERLGLAALLEGTVRQSGGHLRLTVRLIDIGQGCHLWAGRYELGSEQGFEAQDALAHAVAEGIRPHLERLGASRTHPVSG